MISLIWALFIFLNTCKMLYICIICLPESTAFSKKNKIRALSLMRKRKNPVKTFCAFWGPIRLNNSLEVESFLWLFPSVYCSSKEVQFTDGASCLRPIGIFVSFCKDFLSGLLLVTCWTPRKDASPSAVFSDLRVTRM